MKELLTTHEVSRACEVSPRTVVKWIDTGRLNGFRIPTSRHRRIPRSSMLEFMRQHNFPPAMIVEQQPKILTFQTDVSTSDILQQEIEHWEIRIENDVIDAALYAGLEKPHCLVIGQAGENPEHDRFAEKITRLYAPLVIGIGQPNSLLCEIYDEIFQAPFDPHLLAARLQTLIGRPKKASQAP